MSASIVTISTPLTTAATRETATVARTRLRITRRGRAVLGAFLTLLVVGVLAVIAMFGGSQAVASAEAGGAEFGYIVVQPGDSLWEVASSIDPNTDPRDLVAEIVRLNQLDGSGVQAGQPIALPLRYADVPGVVSGAELGV